MAVAATSPIRWEHDAPTVEQHFELVEDHFPLVFIAFAGPIDPQQVLELIRFVDGVRARAAAEGVDILVICDARGSMRPSDLVRDMLVDWLRHELHGPLSPLGSIIVARDPIVRGVIASIKWATGRGDQMVVVPSPEAAMKQAHQRFVAAGLTPPSVLADVPAED